MEIDEAGFGQTIQLFSLVDEKLYLCLALMNLLLGVVLHSSSLVIMAVPMSHWDFIRDFLLPPDILAIRTAGPKWNHAKLYGLFAAFGSFSWKTVKIGKGKPSLLPNGQVNALIFVNGSSIMNQKWLAI